MPREAARCAARKGQENLKKKNYHRFRRQLKFELYNVHGELRLTSDELSRELITI
jgi:hypothetical protein